MADDDRPYEVLHDAGIPVLLPSGGTFYVMTDAEKDWFQDKIDRYQADNHFVNVSDFLDIDKLVIFELFCFRWSLWVSRERDYFDAEIDVKATAELSHKYSVEIRQLKKALGVDKSTRDRTKGEGSVAARWDNVLRRAKHFVYKRNAEAVQAIESFHRIAAMITYYENVDEKEREEFSVGLEDVLEVIKEEIAKFNLIDEEFRARQPTADDPDGGQSYWVRDQ